MRKVSTCLFLIAFTIGLSVSAQEVTEVAVWTFDEDPGSTTIADLTGNGFDLTVGSDGAIVTGGKSGNCLQNTAGILAGIDVATSGDLDGTLLDDALANSYTIEGFWRVDTEITGDSWSTMFKVGRSGGDWQADTHAAYIRDGGGSTMAIIDSGQLAGGLAAPSGGFDAHHGEWIHYALTHDVGTNELKWYVDGELQTTASISTAPDGFGEGTVPKVSFCFDPGDNRDAMTFPGSVDEVRISTGLRYTENFTPPIQVPVELSAFMVD